MHTTTAHYPLPTTHYPLPTTHYPLPTTYYPLPTTHHPLPTTYYVPRLAKDDGGIDTSASDADDENELDEVNDGSSVNVPPP